MFTENLQLNFSLILIEFLQFSAISIHNYNIFAAK